MYYLGIVFPFLSHVIFENLSTILQSICTNYRFKIALEAFTDYFRQQYQRRFHLPFEILTNDRLEAARSGNALTEIPLCIARLDKLSRNDDLQAKLEQTDWDVIVCDEAHKIDLLHE